LLRRAPGVAPRGRASDRRALLDAKLTELTLLATELCPGATVESDTFRYDGEDGGVQVFPPAGLSEEEEWRLQMALSHRTVEIFDDTGLLITCAVLDPTARS
jgi:hypothetical protein